MIIFKFINLKHLKLFKSFNSYNAMDLSCLPNDLQLIVHKYHQQLKYKHVMDELKHVSKTLQQKCTGCQKEFVSFVRCECVSHDICENTFCDECVKLEVEREYEDFMIDANEEERENFNLKNFVCDVIVNIECDYCIHRAYQFNDEEPSDIDDDVYGYYGGW